MSPTSPRFHRHGPAKTPRRRLLVSFLTLAILACGPVPSILAQGAEVAFNDIGLETGFQDRLAHGRALVAADFNQDGWVDFYFGNPSQLPNSDDESLIMWNNGPDEFGDFSFTRGQVLLRAAIAFTASSADYDNDGDQDLFIGIGGQEGIGLDHMLRNDGGVFTDVSLMAGVQGARDLNAQPIPSATSSGNWADYDNDGDLDLLVAVRIHIQSLILPFDMGYRDSLFRNNGNGTFTDVTRESKLWGFGGSMTAAWGDFDLDGWMDVYVPVHDPVGFQLWRNNQDGTFSEVELGIDIGTRAVWSSSVADFNRDGLLDVMSFARGNFPATDSHALLINRGDWVFTNEAIAAGLVPPGVAVPLVMGTAIGDFDNDGYPDIMMGTGGPFVGEADRLYRNSSESHPSGLQFQEVSEKIDYPALDDPNCDAGGLTIVSEPAWVDHNDMLPGSPDDGRSLDTLSLPERLLANAGDDPCIASYPYRGHGSIFVDFDKDGDLDLPMIKGGTAIIAPDLPSTNPNRLFRNDGGNDKNWLFIDLEGVVSNRDALGSRIEVFSSHGGAGLRIQTAQWQGNTGFSATGPEEIHFGLGDDDLVDRIRIRWPSGVRTELTDVAVNQRLQVAENVLFKSDFNDGMASGWTALSGNWSVLNGEYGQQVPSRGLTIHEDGGLTDFTVVSKVAWGAGNENVALLGRVSPSGQDFYGVLLTKTSASIIKSVAGQISFLGQPTSIEPLARRRGYIVSLSFSGSAISMSVDNGPDVTVEDADIVSGSIGLAMNGSAGSFDNVAVY